MHRCQVKMRHNIGTPHTHLMECGDVAAKKVGKLWMCDYHYQRFGVPMQGEEYFANCTGAVDCDESDSKE